MTTIPPVEPVSHADSARRLLEIIRTLPGEVSGFTFTRLPERRKLNSLIGLPTRFLEAAAFLLEGATALRAGVQTDPAAFHDFLAYEQAYMGVVNELREVARAIEYTVAYRRSLVVKLALNVYYVAKRLISPAEDSPLYAHMTFMRDVLASRKRTKKKDEEEEDETPAPKPVGAAS